MIVSIASYDLFWMNVETGKTTRLTFAPGQDVLPVFSPDYTQVMWTSNRKGGVPTQLYVADFTPQGRVTGSRGSGVICSRPL